LNTNGTLDSGFGTGGRVVSNFGGSSYDAASAVVVQADGKIDVGGTTNSNGTRLDFALARYNANGTLDSTFGTAGLVSTNFAGFSTDEIHGLVLQSDGNVVAAGNSDAVWDKDFALARYITSDNHPPLAIAGGPYTVAEGGQVV